MNKRNLNGISELIGEDAFDRNGAAAELGFSVPFVDKERRAGKLQCRYIGTIPIFTVTNLRNYVLGEKS